MKVISYHVRGLDEFEKRNKVRRLVSEKNPFVLCLQESKLSVVDDLLVTAVWGNSPSDYSFQPSVGASRGLLTVWDRNLVDVWSTLSFSHVLVIRGRVISTSQEFVIANVYASCDTTAKQVLWDHLTSFVLKNGDVNLCLCGDFNSVQSVDQRKSRGSIFRQHDEDIFIKFIDNIFLVDFLICGILLTWYR